MDDLISRQAVIDAILSVTGNSSVRELYEHVQEHGLSDMWSGGVNAAIDVIIAVPSAQADSKELSPTHKALDTISRQAAVDRINKQREHLQPEIYPQDKIGDAAYRICAEFIERLPPAQPELPEWAHKVEEYCQNTPSYINNPLAWALYQVWKEYDGRLVHQRGKENR